MGDLDSWDSGCSRKALKRVPLPGLQLEPHLPQGEALLEHGTSESFFFLAPTGHKDTVSKLTQRDFPVTDPTYSSWANLEQNWSGTPAHTHESKISNFKELIPLCKHIINSQGERGFKVLTI